MRKMSCDENACLEFKKKKIIAIQRTIKSGLGNSRQLRQEAAHNHSRSLGSLVVSSHQLTQRSDGQIDHSGGLDVL